MLRIQLSNKKTYQPKATGYCLHYSFDSNILDVRMITQTQNHCIIYIMSFTRRNGVEVDARACHYFVRKKIELCHYLFAHETLCLIKTRINLTLAKNER